MDMQMRQLEALMNQQQRASRTEPLLEFRAGILKQNGTTVTADERRGKVQLVLGEEDGLIHVQWKLRPSDQKELDITILPGGAKIEKIPECTTGRVLLLEQTDSRRRSWFWMQEPKDDKDDSIREKFTNLINNPPHAGGGGFSQDMWGGAAGGGGASGGGDMNQELLRLLAASGATGLPQTGAPSTAAASTPATTTTTTTATSSATGSNNTSNAEADAMLAAIRSTLTANQNSGGVVPTLEGTLTGSALSDALSDKDVSELVQHLPEGQQDEQNLREVTRSPQFQSTLRRLDGILNSAQCGMLMQSFSLPAGEIGVDAFLDAMQNEFGNSDSDDNGGDKDKMDETDN